MAVADAAATTRPTLSPAWVARGVVWLAIGWLVLIVPLQVGDFQSLRLSLGVIYAIVGLSMNVLIGYAGQISLGHQGFLGVGAFTSAYVVTVQGQPFVVGLIAGALTGAVSSLIMGVVALRVRGLYLALVTLAYGRMAQESLFSISLFGSGAGIEAPRPDGFTSDRSYYYLCLAVLAVVVFLDWRLTRTKAGRAINAVRENEQVAFSYGIPVAQFKLLAFVVAGAFVGLAGALFAHRVTRVVGNDFEFNLALLFVIIAVVGGIRSRVGVVIGGAFFALFPEYLVELFHLLERNFSWFPRVLGERGPEISGIIGVLLLILTLIQYPGGIGQQLRPITRWLGGKPFSHEADEGFVEEGVRGRP